MKVIKLSITPAHEGDVVSGSLTIQRKRHDAWMVEDVIPMVSGKPGVERELRLDNDQRVLIEATTDTEVLYDKVQNAAVRMPIKDHPATRREVGIDDEDSDTPVERTAEGALKGFGLTELQQQERRDQAITAARQKVADQPKQSTESTIIAPPPPTPPEPPVSTKKVELK